MRALLQYHAQIDARDEDGNTALNTVVGLSNRDVFTGVSHRGAKTITINRLLEELASELSESE